MKSLPLSLILLLPACRATLPDPPHIPPLASNPSTHSLPIHHDGLLQALPSYPAPPYQIDGLSLSQDPASHSLLVSGPLSLATPTLDLFSFLDATADLSSQIVPLHHANPPAVANALNSLFSPWSHQISPPLVNNFLALPAPDSLLLLAPADTLQEAATLATTLDSHPTYPTHRDDFLQMPIHFVNAPMSEILTQYTHTFGTLFSLPPNLPASITISCSPLNETEATSILEDILAPQGLTLLATHINNPGPLLILRPTPITDSHGKFTLSPDPSHIPDAHVPIIQLIPLSHTSPASIAMTIRDRIPSSCSLYLQPATNSLAISGYADDLRVIVRFIHSLDHPPTP